MSAFKNFSPGGPLGATVDMAEVTRLTRAGRLTEAVALLQGHKMPAEPARPPAPSPSERGTEPAIDLEAPTEPGGAWTVPGQAGTPDPSEALRAMPDALKGLQETLRGMPEALKSFRSPGGLTDLLRAGGLHEGALDGLAGTLAGTLAGNLASHLPAGLGEGLKPRRSVTVPEGARFEERSFASAAGSRTYKVYVPAGREGQRLPVVVMLHGCTQDPTTSPSARG